MGSRKRHAARTTWTLANLRSRRPAMADSSDSMTPLAREQQHAQNERDGKLRFVEVRNDSRPESLVSLTHLKNIFAKQLPKMPREYIVRLVFDRYHEALTCECEGEIVGGIAYRVHPEQSFSEIAFCAVAATHQVQGYGTRLMNQLKEKAKRDKIQCLLTYADNHAIGYFRKQGFYKQVTMKRARWLGYIKDYDGGTLMECVHPPPIFPSLTPLPYFDIVTTLCRCVVDPTVDYLSIRFAAEQQRLAVEQKIATLTNSHVVHPGIDKRARANHEIPGLDESTWEPMILECTLHGQQQPLQKCLQLVFNAIHAHDDAWPFRQSVSVKEAPDYYHVIKVTTSPMWSSWPS